jgi:hypothetical protein
MPPAVLRRTVTDPGSRAAQAHADWIDVTARHRPQEPSMTPSTMPLLNASPVPLGATPPQTDVVFMPRPGAQPQALGHDQLTKLALAHHLAELLEGRFVGMVVAPGDPRSGTDPHADTTPLLLVPSDTLTVGAGAAPPEVFGGIVPQAFIATKVITHPLVAPGALAPTGWSTAFPEAVRDVVLPGWSVFSADDAVIATERLLAGGSVRAKLPSGVGGSGQQVLRSMDELQALLQRLPAEALRAEGLVLERNLSDVKTYSVGQVRVGGWTATYCGTQRLTTNHAGHEVYGGSRLMVVRGDHEVLLNQPIDDAQRRAIEQAMVYHRAAVACYPGMSATRWNYDVAAGVDDTGLPQDGVLEQSWRIGGATGAELAALQAFRDDPELDVVEAETVEVYGEAEDLPPGARLYYDGIDPQVGRLVKYAVARRYGHA